MGESGAWGRYLGQSGECRVQRKMTSTWAGNARGSGADRSGTLHSGEPFLSARLGSLPLLTHGLLSASASLSSTVFISIRLLLLSRQPPSSLPLVGFLSSFMVFSPHRLHSDQKNSKPTVSSD